MTETPKIVREALADRRADAGFAHRLAERVASDKPLLARMSSHACRSARLVESRRGGALLVYECECGARLVRTKAQAEAAAVAP